MAGGKNVVDSKRKIDEFARMQYRKMQRIGRSLRKFTRPTGVSIRAAAAVAAATALDLEMSV